MSQIVPLHSSSKAYLNRIFIVGAPRSGTTLVQQVIATSPSVLTFPETHLLTEMRNRGSSVSVLAGLSWSLRSRRWIDRHVDTGLRPKVTFRRDNVAKNFFDALDQIAAERGCSTWVEKTPAHVRWIEAITQILPDAKFVHCVRNPIDTAISIHHAWNHSFSIKNSLHRSVSSMLTSLQWAGEENHCLVRYEELISSTDPTIERLRIALGLKDIQDLQSMDLSKSYNLVALESESAWKANNAQSKPIQITRDRDEDWHNLRDQYDWILKKLDEFVSSEPN